MITQSALSLEYVPAAITATSMGMPVNPTGDPVSFAFTVGAAQARLRRLEGGLRGTAPSPARPAPPTSRTASSDQAAP